MKTLFSLTYYTPYISGLTLYVQRLAKRLGEKHTVTVLCLRHDKDLAVEERIGQTRIVRARPLVKISKGFLSLDWVFKSIKETAASELVFINLPQLEGIIPAFFGKITGKKVLVIYHCDIVLPAGWVNALGQRMINLTNFLTLRLADKVITYTRDYANHSSLLMRFPEKIKVVYPLIEEPKDKSIQKFISNKIAKKPRFTIGVAARLAADKGIEYLLEAIPLINETMSQLYNVTPQNLTLGYKSEGRFTGQAKEGKKELLQPLFKIVIAGPMEPVGEEAYRKKIMKLVEKYKDNIVFLGSIDPDKMGSFYSLIDVLVLPSVNSTEAFGMVQVEAMMTGVPVIASDLPGVRVPVEKSGMGIIVPKRNSKALAEAITEALSNPQKYFRQKIIIESEFSWQKTVDFYEKLIS